MLREQVEGEPPSRMWRSAIRGIIMNKGYGSAKLDKSSTNSDAIRGREQQLIDQNGGAKQSGGTSGNQINSVSQKNLKKDKYKEAAKKEFGGS